MCVHKIRDTTVLHYWDYDPYLGLKMDFSTDISASLIWNFMILSRTKLESLRLSKSVPSPENRPSIVYSSTS